MTFWQRAIAIFLLMVFTPAAALAGTSLRYCKGADGHQGIEFVLKDSGHHGATDLTAEPSLDVATATFVDGTDCSDRPVFSPGNQTSRIEPVKIKTALDSLPPLLPLLLALIEPQQDVEFIDLPYAADHAADPRLADRETVVLLI